MPVVVIGGNVGSNNTPIIGGSNSAINGTTGVVLPTWTTSTRPASPGIGAQGWNTDIGYEIWTGSGWARIMAKG